MPKKTPPVMGVRLKQALEGSAADAQAAIDDPSQNTRIVKRFEKQGIDLRDVIYIVSCLRNLAAQVDEHVCAEFGQAGRFYGLAALEALTKHRGNPGEFLTSLLGMDLDLPKDKDKDRDKVTVDVKPSLALVTMANNARLDCQDCLNPTCDARDPDYSLNLVQLRVRPEEKPPQTDQ